MLTLLEKKIIIKNYRYLLMKWFENIYEFDQFYKKYWNNIPIKYFLFSVKKITKI